MSRQSEIRKYIVKSIGKENVNYCDKTLGIFEEIYNLGKYDGEKEYKQTKRTKQESPDSSSELSFLE